MNIKQIVASVSLLMAAGAAMAAPAELNFPSAAVQKSSSTREQVKADTLAARASGSLDVSEASAGKQTSQPSIRSRADVRAETLAALASGRLDGSEAYAGKQITQPSTRTRADVRAETLAASAAGLLEQNETNYPVNYNDLGRRAKVTATLQATGQ